jgi:hypothetical protein
MSELAEAGQAQVWQTELEARHAKTAHQHRRISGPFDQARSQRIMSRGQEKGTVSIAQQ